ncbi:MAG: vitamin K epoxide reductase family protein [Phycisphaerales bacterium]|nr:vitamin K epoxide reductase family protein [Phycisphaerales bacterium]
MLYEVLNNYENPVLVTIDLIKRLGLKRITNDSVNEELNGHPDYPSLLSIQDSLTKWGGDVVCIKTSEEKFNEIPLPFLTVVKGEFAVVFKVESDQVFYSTGNTKNNKVTKEEFLKMWNSIVLLADLSAAKGEEDYEKKKAKSFMKSLLYPFLIFLGFLTVLYSFSESYQFASLGMSDHILVGLLYLLKLGGVVVSALLLWYEVDKANPILEKFCGGGLGGGKTNCSAILNSKQAKFLNIISWSEVGYLYFGSTILALLFATIAGESTFKDVLSLIIIINIPTLVYPFFSIYYQWRVAKQWCVFCLTVQVILITEFIVGLATGGLLQAFTNFPEHWAIDLVEYIGFPFIFLIIFWYVFKPFFISFQQIVRDKRELMRIKFDNLVYESLRDKGKKMTESPDGLGIPLGNPDAKHVVIKACNPYCGPCAKAHPEIDKLLVQVRDLRVQVIFTATTDEKDKKAQPVRHLLAIAAKGDEKLTHQALDDWYLATKKDYDEFAKKYPMTEDELMAQNPKIDAMKKWCDAVEIQYTPTIFVDGYEVPKTYNIKDLPYFLAE